MTREQFIVYLLSRREMAKLRFGLLFSAFVLLATSFLTEIYSYFSSDISVAIPGLVLTAWSIIVPSNLLPILIFLVTVKIACVIFMYKMAALVVISRSTNTVTGP